jgi:hypothetical protein
MVYEQRIRRGRMAFNDMSCFAAPAVTIYVFHGTFRSLSADTFSVQSESNNHSISDY